MHMIPRAVNPCNIAHKLILVLYHNPEPHAVTPGLALVKLPLGDQGEIISHTGVICMYGLGSRISFWALLFELEV